MQEGMRVGGFCQLSEECFCGSWLDTEDVLTLLVSVFQVLELSLLPSKNFVSASLSSRSQTDPAKSCPFLQSSSGLLSLSKKRVALCHSGDTGTEPTLTS